MITVLYPYYNQPKMYLEHLELWENYPKRIREQLKFIVIDDGSSHPPSWAVACRATNLIDLRLFTIEDKIPWNTSGARNLGFHVADTCWVLSMDMDHDIPAEEMEKILGLDLRDPKRAHRFWRREFDGRDCGEVHSNCYLLRKDVYWHAGGHDESYRGSYGYEDCAFRRVLRAVGVTFVDHRGITIRGRPDIADAITPGLPRDTKPNAAKFFQLSQQGDSRVLAYKNKLKPLQFKWREEVLK